MDLALDITSNRRVRVLLVPVSPIKKSTFYKHVDLLKTFHMVRLGDVTPDLKEGASARFSSQVFQEGQMQFEFITHWTREHAELEDFQPHRRIFGVIGIMDCQEWKDKGLSKGYKQFAQDLNKYPTAVATRCFAFDPTETQEDDTKGLIMIPNVGNMAFYMSTMICDFASEILNQFAILAKRIESLPVLESPLPNTIHIPARRRPSSHLRHSQPPLSPHASPNTIKRASLQPSINTAHATAMNAASTGETMRTKKRTPGRIKKLLGDFYLLAGRLPDALNHYEQAIEMAKITSDYLWLASGMEGWVCGTLLLEYLQADVGHIVTRSTSDTTTTSSDSASLESKPAEEELTSLPTIIGPRSTLTMIVEQYLKIATNYSRVSVTANFPVPDLVYAECCLKIARVLTIAYLNNGWSQHTMALVVQGKLEQSTKTSFISTTNDLVKLKQSGIPRYDIAGWITKIWETHLSELALLDQIYITTSMSTLYSSIGYHRKSAWLMHESVNRMLPFLIQHRRSSHTKLLPTTHDNGVIELLKRICEIYGIGERRVSSYVQEIPCKRIRFGWSELQIDVLKQCISVADALLDNRSRLYYTTVLLKNLYPYIPKAEQIKLATTIQGMVANSSAKKASTQVVRGVETMNYWGVNIVSSVEARKPISRKAVYAHPIKSEALVKAVKQEVLETNDPFIYNPFAKKVDTTYKVLLVKDEMSEFKITLTNPFGFDLELQNIALSATGIKFNAVPTAITIPANATMHIVLMGTPEETGILMIRGCLIQIVGFAEQEFLVNQVSKKSPEDTSNDDFVKIKHSGLRAIKSNAKTIGPSDCEAAKFYQVNVIEDQPLLKIKTTSMMHNAIMLFEGEVTHITISLENIGNIAVDFITLSFADFSTMNPFTINPELPTEDQYEIELYTKGTRVFSWEGSADKTYLNDFKGKKIWLPPGATTTIVVNVYGKRDSHGGTIQVDYGYLDRTVSEVVEEIKASNNEIQDIPRAMFYTRQLYLNVLITVYRNLEPFNWDVIYLRYNTPAPKHILDEALQNIKQQQDSFKTKDGTMIRHQPVEDLLLVTRNIKLENQERNDYCLVTLDIHNLWTTPFDVQIKIDNRLDDDLDELLSCITIQPGLTSRIVLPMRRLFLPSDICSQEIPSFDPNKQFVVSQGPKMSEEQRKARLLIFWYREELLNRIKATWHCQSTGRWGQFNLRSSLRLNVTQLSVLKKEDVEFLVDVKGHRVNKLTHRRFSCCCNDYVTMTISIRNRFTYPIKLILRIQPVQSCNGDLKQYDLSDKLLVEGLEQIVLPEIPANNVLSHSFHMFFLSRGQFEIVYHAEDLFTRQIYYDHEWVVVDVVE